VDRLLTVCAPGLLELGSRARCPLTRVFGVCTRLHPGEVWTIDGEGYVAGSTNAELVLAVDGIPLTASGDRLVRWLLDHPRRVDVGAIRRWRMMSDMKALHLMLQAMP